MIPSHVVITNCHHAKTGLKKPKLTGFLKSNDILEQWSILNPKTYNLAITTLNGHHITTHTLHDAHRKIPRDLIHQTLFRNCRKPQHKNLITHKFELPNPPKPHLQPPNSTRVAAPPREPSGSYCERRRRRARARLPEAGGEGERGPRPSNRRRRLHRRRRRRGGSNSSSSSNGGSLIGYRVMRQRAPPSPSLSPS